MLNASDLPASPGAYALVLALAAPCRLDIPRLGRPVLPAGLYLYAGSARGPGGIRARLGRHLRGVGPAHWHVDHLRARAEVAAAFAYPGARECAVIEDALAHDATVPVPGFGSSDCRGCAAHLLAIEPALVRLLQNRDSRGDRERSPSV